MVITIFVVVLITRWLTQAILAWTSSLRGPQDVLSAAHLIAYLTLSSLAYTVGNIGLPSLVFLSMGLLIRLPALWLLRERFEYSVTASSSPSLVLSGIYRVHRNPLALGLWCELVAFSVALPLPLPCYLFLILFLGLLSAWHAHEDNNRLASRSAEYAAYLPTARNTFLNLFFPERARLIDHPYFHIDTYGLYALLGFLVGELVAIGYGIPATLFVFALPGVFFGALFYWQMTAKNSPLRIGFSFFGGLAGGTTACAVFLLATGTFNMRNWTSLVLALVGGHAVGRLGCIAHGCCTGQRREEHLPYFVAYRDPNQRINRVNQVARSFCFPTVQLEALGQLALAFICFYWKDVSLAVGLLGYGGLRILIQTLRVEVGDPTRIAISSLMVLVGSWAASFAPMTSAPTWRTPPVAQIVLAVILALLTSLGYGFRISSPKSTDAPAVT